MVGLILRVKYCSMMSVFESVGACTVVSGFATGLNLTADYLWL